MAPRTLLLYLLLIPAACGPGTVSEQTSLTVVRIVPDLDPARQTVFLNQPIRIDFSMALDRLSITNDTVRILDGDGRVVPGRLQTGLRSVTVLPAPPLAADFMDGGLKPGGTYRIEIAGFPRANAVRDQDGLVLERTLTRTFRTLPADLTGSGLTSHLLPVAQPGTSFQLRDQGPLRIAADLGTLQIPFTLPLLPSSVSVGSFKLFSSKPSSGHDIEEVLVASARVVTRSVTEDPHPGCTVELTLLHREALRSEDVLFLMMMGGEYAVRDYDGRPVEPLQATGGFLQVAVDPGATRRVIHEAFDARGPTVFTAEGQVVSGGHMQQARGPGFLTRDGRAVPRVYQEAGTGVLKDYRPLHSVTLGPSTPFEGPDGLVLTSTNGSFEFRSLHVPKGVQLRIEGIPGQTLKVLIAGDLVVDGELILVTGEGRPLQAQTSMPFADLQARAGALLVCGGELRVHGRLQAATTSPRDGSLVIVAGGDVSWRGPWHPTLRLAAVPTSQVKAPPELRLISTTLRIGVPEFARIPVESYTRWYPLGRPYMSTVDCRPDEIDGRMDLFVQIASPDPLDPQRPDHSNGALSPPFQIPPGMPLHVPHGGFVRFLLRAEVTAGERVPSVAGISLFDR